MEYWINFSARLILFTNLNLDFQKCSLFYSIYEEEKRIMFMCGYLFFHGQQKLKRMRGKILMVHILEQ